MADIYTILLLLKHNYKAAPVGVSVLNTDSDPDFVFSDSGKFYAKYF